MSQDSVVQVAPDGAGKNIRNISTYVMVDGVPTLVQQQILGGITDENGNLIELASNNRLEELLHQTTRQTAALELLLRVFGAGSIDDEVSIAGYQAIRGLGAPAQSSTPTNAVGDAFGRQIVLPWGSREMFVPGLPATITTATIQTLKAAEADVYLDLSLLLISNTSATAVRVDVTDGTNVYPFQCPAGVTTGFSSGLILPATNRNAAWSVTVASAVTDIRIVSLFVRNK